MCHNKSHVWDQPFFYCMDGDFHAIVCVPENPHMIRLQLTRLDFSSLEPLFADLDRPILDILKWVHVVEIRDNSWHMTLMRTEILLTGQSFCCFQKREDTDRNKPESKTWIIGLDILYPAWFSDHNLFWSIVGKYIPLIFANRLKDIKLKDVQWFFLNDQMIKEEWKYVKYLLFKRTYNRLKRKYKTCLATFFYYSLSGILTGNKCVPFLV